MEGVNGHRYFMFLCNFNYSADIYKYIVTNCNPEIVPNGSRLWSTMGHLCDYTDDLFLSGGGSVITTAEDAFDEADNALTLRNPQEDVDLRFRYKGDEVYVYAKTNIFECELKCTGGKRFMWMQDGMNKEAFIREGAANDQSFYYSLPQLPYSGWIKYKDTTGKEVKTEVYG